MAHENLCMYCFEDLGGKNVCPHCGRDSRAAVPQVQLLPGTLLYRGRFLVGRAMGQDASGIVYVAYDTKRESKLRVREYLPRDSARRLNDGTVVPAAGAEDTFEKGLQRLKSSVEGVDDPKKRHFFFEENGTGYIAQRKNAAQAAGAQSIEDRPERSAKQWAMIIGIAAVAVLVVAFLLIRLLTTASDLPNVSPNATLSSSDSLWTPEETPSPTPFASSSYAPIKDPELSWMDYTYDRDVNKEVEKQENNARTNPPNTKVTPRPTSQLVNGSSSSTEIRDLQWELIELGWLNYTKPNAKYDSATKKAVKEFQQYMNSTYAIDPKLDVDGIAGPATLYWLDQYSVSRKPTPTPTLPVKVTPTPGGSVVNESSSKSAIREVQRYLITLGMLSSGSDDGVYGAATRGGVWEFQAHINKILGRDILKISGEVDSLTLSYLEFYSDWWESVKPTPTANVTAKITPSPTPDITEGPNVGPDSPRESILYVQEQLMKLGLLSSANGTYDQTTATAVRNFQIGVNERQGFKAVEITGLCDGTTLNYLEHYVYLVTPVPDATATATIVPTPTPTLEPKHTPDPTDDPGEGDLDNKPIVDENSDPDSILYMQDMLVSLGLLDKADGAFGSATVNAVRAFQEMVNRDSGKEVVSVNGIYTGSTAGYLETYYDNLQAQPSATPSATPPTIGEVSDPEISFSATTGFDEGINYVDSNFTISWSADGEVSAYRVVITDTNGKEAINQTVAAAQTSINVAIANLAQDEIYEVSVSAIPLNGTEADATNTFAYFARKAEEVTVPPIGEVTAPTVSVSNIDHVDNGITYVSGDTTISWQADGDIESYGLRISDENGNYVVSPTKTDKESITIPASNMQAGMVYTIEVASVPKNGSMDDAEISTARFAIYVAATEEPTPVPTPDIGEVTAPTVSVSNIDHVDNGITYVSGDTTISWQADGDIESYGLRISDENGNYVVSPTKTDKESITIPASNMQAGMVYTIEIAAVPRNGSMDDAEISSARFAISVAATEEPTSEPDEPTVPSFPATIDESSSSDSVLQMQNMLYSLGFLYPDEDPEKGVYDEATRNAILRFQQNYNTVNAGAPLIEIDPTNSEAIVDATTLSILMNSAG